MVGFPGADLVTPAGGVLINVPRRPANAAHHLTLNSGDTATADVTASAIDAATGNACPRWGGLVVTAPNDECRTRERRRAMRRDGQLGRLTPRSGYWQPPTGVVTTR